MKTCPICKKKSLVVSIFGIICANPECPYESKENMNKTYEQDYSHSHCWNQETPACGQPIEKHTQCCLCSMKSPAELNLASQEETPCFECDHIGGDCGRHNPPQSIEEGLKIEFAKWYQKKDDYGTDYVADWWLSKLSLARTEERAIYENCPQCEGLGKKMVAEYKAELKDFVEVETGKWSSASAQRALGNIVNFISPNKG